MQKWVRCIKISHTIGAIEIDIADLPLDFDSSVPIALFGPNSCAKDEMGVFEIHFKRKRIKTISKIQKYFESRNGLDAVYQDFSFHRSH